MKISRLIAVTACVLVGGTGFWFVGGAANGNGNSNDFPIIDAITSSNRMLDAMSSRLDLTDAQKQKVSAIMSSARSADEPTIDQLKQDVKSLRGMSESNNIDQTQLNAVAKSTADTSVDLLVDVARTKSQVYAVLTPDQREKVKQMQAMGMSKLRDRFATMQSNRGRMFKFIGAKLDLTPDQKQQAMTILSSEKDSARSNVMEIAQDLKAIRSVTQNGNFNETEVRAQAQKAEQPMEALIVDSVETRSKLYALLTPEQQAKVLAMQNSFRAKIAERIMDRFSGSSQSDSTDSVM